MFLNARGVLFLNLKRMYISATSENVTARYEAICIVEASSTSRINKPPKLKKNPAAIKHIAPKISLLNFIFIYFAVYLN